MINCEEDVLKNISSEMMSKAEDILKNINKINYDIENLSKVWTGNDAAKYLQAMREKNIPELKKIYNLLKDYANYLQKVSNTYTSLDEIYGSKSIG